MPASFEERRATSLQSSNTRGSAGRDEWKMLAVDERRAEPTRQLALTPGPLPMGEGVVCGLGMMWTAQRRCDYVRGTAAGSTAVLAEGTNSPSEWSAPVMMASILAVGKPSRRSGASSRRRRAKARGSQPTSRGFFAKLPLTRNLRAAAAFVFSTTTNSRQNAEGFEFFSPTPPNELPAMLG